jgi:hypothetical protein
VKEVAGQIRALRQDEAPLSDLAGPGVSQSILDTLTVMSLRMSRRKWEKMTRAEQAAEEAACAAAERGIVTSARKVLEIWNARSDLFFYPTIRAAIAAGCPWLDYMCPACCRVGEIDLRQVDRHPDASISSMIQELSCRSCRPNPPFARLVRLNGRSAESDRRERISRPKRNR